MLLMRVRVCVCVGVGVGGLKWIQYETEYANDEFSEGFRCYAVCGCFFSGSRWCDCVGIAERDLEIFARFVRGNNDAEEKKRKREKRLAADFMLLIRGMGCILKAARATERRPAGAGTSHTGIPACLPLCCLYTPRHPLTRPHPVGGSGSKSTRY